MKLTEIYKSMLSFVGASAADDTGLIAISFEGIKIPLTVAGKNVIIPTEAALRDPKGNAVFHPLAEVVVAAETELLSKFRKWINLRLNITTREVMRRLLTLVAASELHAKLDPEQSELLLAVKDVDETTCINLLNYCRKQMDDGKGDNTLVNIYLRRGGEHQGKKAFCVGVVSFPMYKKLTDETEGKASIGCRIKDRKAYKDVLGYMFPDLETPGSYSYGSYSNVAKHTDALMMSAANVATNLNKLINTFGELLDIVLTEGQPSHKELLFDMSYLEYFTAIDNYKKDIQVVPIQNTEEPSEVKPQASLAVPIQNKDNKPKSGATLAELTAAARGQQGFNFNNNNISGGMGGLGGFNNGGLVDMSNPLYAEHMRQTGGFNNLSGGGLGGTTINGLNFGGSQNNNGQMKPGAVVNVNGVQYVVAENGSLLPVAGGVQANVGNNVLGSSTGNRWAALRNR